MAIRTAVGDHRPSGIAAAPTPLPITTGRRILGAARKRTAGKASGGDTGGDHRPSGILAAGRGEAAVRARRTKPAGGVSASAASITAAPAKKKKSTFNISLTGGQGAGLTRSGLTIN